MWIIQEMALDTHRTLFLCRERQPPCDAVALNRLFCFDGHAGDGSKIFVHQRANTETGLDTPKYDTWQTANDVLTPLQPKKGG